MSILGMFNPGSQCFLAKEEKTLFASDLKEERTKYWELQREQGCTARSQKSRLPDSQKPDTCFLDQNTTMNESDVLTQTQLT